MENVVNELLLEKELRNKIDQKTKPPGALGRLEEIALQIGTIQRTLTPQINKPHIVVFAGDHGIAKTGLVNPYPQEVTAQMVLNFLKGGAAINVFCRQNKIELTVVDAGVNYQWNENLAAPNFIQSKIGFGTRNYLEEKAMTNAEAIRCIDEGKNIVAGIAATGCNTIGFGEMGIGNSSAAALLMSAVLHLPVEDCLGRGTGVNKDQLATKTKTLQQVADKHQQTVKSNPDPLSALACYGGFEIAMMTGAYIQAKKEELVVIVDGFISTASLLLATMIDPSILSNCVFAHTSGEQGHKKMLKFLHVKPLLNLGLRLGEGTGAALAIPLLQSAVAFLNEMASFSNSGVSDKSE